MTVTITLAGVRGGQGTSTSAAALALLAARRTDCVELVTHEVSNSVGSFERRAHPPPTW